MVVFRSHRERQTGLDGELHTECIDLSATQCVDQVSRENDALSLAPSQVLLDQMIGAILQRQPYLPAEAALAEFDWFTCFIIATIRVVISAIDRCEVVNIPPASHIRPTATYPRRPANICDGPEPSCS